MFVATHDEGYKVKKRKLNGEIAEEYTSTTYIICADEETNYESVVVIEFENIEE